MLNNNQKYTVTNQNCYLHTLEILVWTKLDIWMKSNKRGKHNT